MKNVKYILLIVVYLVVNGVFAQSSAHLVLSTPYPHSGEKISFTYNPAGTPLAKIPGKPQAKVYFRKNSDYVPVDIAVVAQGKVYKGEISIPVDAKAFFMVLSNNSVIDANSGKGYITLVYDGDKPVEGAYAAKAVIITGRVGNKAAEIELNNSEGIAAYKKEFELYPQSEKRYEEGYYNLLAGDLSNAAIVNKKIIELAKRNDENDQLKAVMLYKIMKSDASADSLTKVIKTRFPDGITVTNEAVKSIQQEKDLEKKEAIFNEFVAKHPQLSVTSKDALLMRILPVYLKRQDMATYYKYAGQLSDKTDLPNLLNSVAWSWALDSVNLANAEQLSRQSLDLTLANNKAGTAAELIPAAQNSYDAFADTYAFILWKEHKFDEAVKYMQGVYDRQPGSDAEITEHYVLMLNSAGKHNKALQVAEQSITNGKNSNIIEQELKKAYAGAKGGMTGFNTYWTNLQKANSAKKDQEKKKFEKEQQKVLGNEGSVANKQQLAELKKELNSKMIKDPAPLFTLKDLQGKPVSLANLKGKTVIIDFWATWCGPCKMSFPGMQIAQNKYKDNPDVVFLFIDTWETGSNYLPGVKRFIAENNYSFHVLVDEKGADKRQSKVISTFKVEGIPTKFIIDKNGDIRFKYVGYSGTTEAVVNEVTAMIDLVNDPVAKIEVATPGTSAVGGTASPSSVNK
nr:redoxin domain-containing protein [uncultured Mucilaginibacter sp.]